jgi:hypothetical protein
MRSRTGFALAVALLVVVVAGAIVVGAPRVTSEVDPSGAASTDVPAVALASPSADPIASPLVSVQPSADPTWLPSDSLPPVSEPATVTPSATPRPANTAAGPLSRVATRVQIAALGIDLPVIRQRTAYPACNVAMYLKELRQPGQGGSTYLYAHARVGMFLPILTRSKVNNGARMIGMTVKVWTGDSRVFVYRIYQVRRHIRSLDPAFAARGERLWLQTSEGPNHTYPKLQVVASFVSSGPADYAEAHPKPRPIYCG